MQIKEKAKTGTPKGMENVAVRLEVLEDGLFTTPALLEKLKVGEIAKLSARRSSVRLRI